MIHSTSHDHSISQFNNSCIQICFIQDDVVCNIKGPNLTKTNVVWSTKTMYMKMRDVIVNHKNIIYKTHIRKLML